MPQSLGGPYHYLLEAFGPRSLGAPSQFPFSVAEHYSWGRFRLHVGSCRLCAVCKISGPIDSRLAIPSACCHCVPTQYGAPSTQNLEPISGLSVVIRALLFSELVAGFFLPVCCIFVLLWLSIFPTWARVYPVAFGLVSEPRR